MISPSLLNQGFQFQVSEVFGFNILFILLLIAGQLTPHHFSTFLSKSVNCNIT